MKEKYKRLLRKLDSMKVKPRTAQSIKDECLERITFIKQNLRWVLLLMDNYQAQPLTIHELITLGKVKTKTEEMLREMGRAVDAIDRATTKSKV